MAAVRQARAQDAACVLCLGDGPFSRHNMAALLATRGIAPLDPRSKGCPTLLVCGRDNLNADRVHGLMHTPHCAPLLCAQEHVLHVLFSDWEERSHSGLLSLKHHPIYRWVTPRDAPQEDVACAVDSAAAPAHIFSPGALLQVLPYVECALHGTQARRRKVLRQAYVMDLRALEQVAPMTDAGSPNQRHSRWGRRRSASRLRHVAASLAQARQHRDSPLALRGICSKDLSWLRVNMYDAGGFAFPWPSG